MKKTIKFMASIALAMLIYQGGFAQDTNPNPSTQPQDNTQNQTQENPQNTDMRQQTQQDLLNRYPDLDEQGINWEDTEDGYSATYNMNDTDYMARYDAEGNWLETMEKREWDDNVPEHVKLGLTNNAYENYEVDSYWEITESDSDMGQGYFFNLKDKEGNTKNLRMDPQGTILNDNDYNDPR